MRPAGPKRPVLRANSQSDETVDGRQRAAIDEVQEVADRMSETFVALVEETVVRIAAT